MFTNRFRSKRVIVPAVAAACALGIGGVAWASTANADLHGNDADRVRDAAVRAVGGGTVTDAETSDDLGEAYEVEVRKADGTEIDVALDENLAVVSRETDDRDDRDDADDRDDVDDRVLSSSERSSAGKAAVAAVGGGTATDVEASDDLGQAYEVEVVESDGSEWDVDLDAGFKVLSKSLDD
jgi:uncharacterized membrane protein YkoI